MDYPSSVPSAGLVNGKFVDEDPLAGTPGSLIPASWGNGVTEEILGVIGAANLTATEGNNKQLLEAIKKLLSDASKRSGILSGLLVNASFSITVASQTGTFKADELSVQSAPSGVGYRLQNFSKVINLATTGVGGMDVGPAPVNGYVALYAIYNSVTGEQNILAVNSTSTIAPGVYGGGKMPNGYDASALISVWATDVSGKLKVGAQRGRKVFIPLFQAFRGTVLLNASPLSIAGVVPPNAFEINGEMILLNNTGVLSFFNMVLSTNGGLGQQITSIKLDSGGSLGSNYSMPVIAPQTITITCQSDSTAPVFEVYIGSYSFS
ncbi:hypothetical protein [Pseudomonas sp. 31-12]|uniref:hypothetical protein n=1 Tax=Pseudomonas sp. 31-12 TaxID=2201356 RepID=UPI002114F889|nr:hypothetical protein [Pseudomonas sp. 31-12]